MSLTPEERVQRKAFFRQMAPAEKVDYIATYYRISILAGLLLLILLGFWIYGAASRKEPILYLGYVNVSVREEMRCQLTEGYVTFSGHDPDRCEVIADQPLYLSQDPSAANHQYEYASQMKLMASIAAGQLDLVFMNQEGYDTLSQKGYLRDLEEFLLQDPALYDRIREYLTGNTVVLEDNATEYVLNETDSYQAVTETRFNALNVTSFPQFEQDGGLTGQVYLGVLAEGPRLDTALDYIRYLADGLSSE